MAVAAVLSNVDDAFVWAVVVAAGVNCHHVVCSLVAFSGLIWCLPSLALSGFTGFAGTVVRGSGGIAMIDAYFGLVASWLAHTQG
ncbi:MAG TPA: hypothetical protein VGR71_10460, partial [Nitrospira sp.]|nr:hypothetical protein [Nitrospira sp.]